MLILGSPWLLAAISISLAVLNSSADFPVGHNEVRWIARINWLVAPAGSAYGGLAARGPVPIRVAVVIATMIYGAAIYVILVSVPQLFGLRSLL